MTKILIIDDEKLLVKGLQRSLTGEGFEVEAAYDGHEGLSKVKSHLPDLVILDIMLPGMDGFEVCRRLRSVSDVPVIMLTARGEDIDKIVGLELGADDYLAKPFNTRELIARIRAILRRRPSFREHAVDTQTPAALDRMIRAGELEIDAACQRVIVKGEQVSLTTREFELLHALARNPGRVLTRDVLLEQVWGSRYYGEPRVVDVYVRRLRQKIEPDPANPRWIFTRWGAGYFFQGEE